MDTTPVPGGQSLADSGDRASQKKARGTTDTGDEGDEDDISGRQRQKTSKREELEAPFACPFYKRDAVKHHRCGSLTLSRIRDVKQHLVRRHLQPPFCATCGATFEIQDLCAAHSKERLCVYSDIIQEPEGITTAQRHLIAQRSHRRQSKVEQWFTVWDIIFPSSPRPQSPFISDAIDEVIDDLHRFFDREGEAVIRRELDAMFRRDATQDDCRISPAVVLECGRQLLQAYTTSVRNSQREVGGPIHERRSAVPPDFDYDSTLWLAESDVASTTPGSGATLFPWRDKGAFDIVGEPAERLHDKEHGLGLGIADSLEIDWSNKLAKKIVADLGPVRFEDEDPESLQHIFHPMLEGFAHHLAGESLTQAGSDASFYVSKNSE